MFVHTTGVVYELRRARGIVPENKGREKKRDTQLSVLPHRGIRQICTIVLAGEYHFHTITHDPFSNGIWFA